MVWHTIWSPRSRWRGGWKSLAIFSGRTPSCVCAPSAGRSPSPCGTPACARTAPPSGKRRTTAILPSHRSDRLSWTPSFVILRRSRSAGGKDGSGSTRCLLSSRTWRIGSGRPREMPAGRRTMSPRREVARDPFGGEPGLQDAVVQGNPPVGVAVQVDAGIGGEPFLDPPERLPVADEVLGDPPLVIEGTGEDRVGRHPHRHRQLGADETDKLFGRQGRKLRAAHPSHHRPDQGLPLGGPVREDARIPQRTEDLPLFPAGDEEAEPVERIAKGRLV